MQKRLLVLVLGLAFIAGCSESQMKKTDAVVQQGQAIGTAVAAVAPAIPPPYGEIVGGIALLVSVLAGAWQTYRKGQVTAALDDVATAVAVKAGTPSITTTEIPGNVISASTVNAATVDELKKLGY